MATSANALAPKQTAQICGRFPMLRNPRRYVPNTTVTHIEFASSKSSQNGGPYRTNLKRGRASTYSPASTHPHIPTTPSPRYSPYPRKPIHTHETPSPTSTHHHLSSSSNGSSTLCSCHSGSIRLSTTAQQSKLLCGVHTSAELSPYRSRADLCLPQIQVRHHPQTILSITLNIHRTLRSSPPTIHSPIPWNLT